MGLTITINSTEDMCHLMCGNEIPTEKENKRMTIEETMKYYSKKYGILIYAEYDSKDKRKRFYRINYPVFEDGNVLPVSNKDYLVKTPTEARKYIDSVLLSNEKYKTQCEQWLANY